MIGLTLFKRHRKLLISIALFCAALLLRIAYLRNTVIDRPIRADAREYVVYGFNLARHGTFSIQENIDNPTPDGHRTPGYPLLVALAFVLKKKQFYPVVLYMQAFLGAVTAVLTLYCGIWFMPFGWALAAAILVVFCPHLVSWTGYLLSETLFSCVLLAAIAFFYHGLRKSSIMLLLLSALFFGYSHMTTPTMVFVPIILGVLVPVFAKIKKTDALPNRKTTAGIVIFLVVFLMFPIGWSVRNKVNLAPGVLTGSGRFMTALASGAYPGYIYKNPELRYYPHRDDPQWEEFRGSLSNFSRIFWERFKERPGRFIVWYLFEKPYVLWSWNIIQGTGDVYQYPVKTSLYQISPVADLTRVIMKILHPVVLLLMLAGLPVAYIMMKRGGMPADLSANPIIIMVILIYYTLLFIVLGPLPRYAVPLRPEQYLWVTWTVSAGLQILHERKEPSRSKNKHTSKRKSYGTGT